MSADNQQERLEKVLDEFFSEKGTSLSSKSTISEDVERVLNYVVREMLQSHPKRAVLYIERREDDSRYDIRFRSI